MLFQRPERPPSVEKLENQSRSLALEPLSIEYSRDRRRHREHAVHCLLPPLRPLACLNRRVACLCAREKGGFVSEQAKLCEGPCGEEITGHARVGLPRHAL